MFPVQIYVEIERARLTRTLAKIKEDAGKITEAAEILQELQVTVTSLVHCFKVKERSFRGSTLVFSVLDSFYNEGTLLQGRNCFARSNFFPLRIDPILERLS